MWGKVSIKTFVYYLYRHKRAVEYWPLFARVTHHVEQRFKLCFRLSKDTVEAALICQKDNKD